MTNDKDDMPAPKTAMADGEDRKNRLIQAVLSGWTQNGTSELSARTIGARAGASASAIYYHFGDAEHLYDAASRAALTQARSWCAAQEARIAALPLDAGRGDTAIGPIMASLIDDLCGPDRALALAWRETHLLAARRADFAPLWAEWVALWRGFWLRLCRRLAIEAAAPLCHAFFDGELCMHLMPWNRPGDRACLDEMTRGLAACISGAPLPPAPWRAMLKRQAIEATVVADRSEALIGEIGRAAADLLAMGGIGAITHRAVAERAGLTLGTVSHRFKRADDLLRLAYNETYHILTGLSPNPAHPGTPTAPAGSVPARNRVVAIDELMLAVARGRAQPGLALALRYLRGRSSQFAIADATSLRGDALDLGAAIYSSMMMGALHHNIHRNEADAAAETQAAHDDMLARLARCGGGGS